MTNYSHSELFFRIGFLGFWPTRLVESIQIVGRSQQLILRETWQAGWWHPIITRYFYSKTFRPLLPEILRSVIWGHPGGRRKLCAVIACVLLGVRRWNFVGRCSREGTFRDNKFVLNHFDLSSWTIDH